MIATGRVVVAAAPRPSAAMPPARKLRRAGRATDATGRQHAQPRKNPWRAGFSALAAVPETLALISALLRFVVRSVWRELNRTRVFGKPSGSSAAAPHDILTIETKL
jgi:hypothetical protein